MVRASLQVTFHGLSTSNRFSSIFSRPAALAIACVGPPHRAIPALLDEKTVAARPTQMV